MDNINFAEQSPASITRGSYVIVFTSGKGGVGKTCVTTNVATAMALRGARVCIFDADTGLANINILLGLRPEFTLEHVLKGEKSIHQILIKTAQGVGVVPGATGIAELANLNTEKVKRLCAALTELEAEYDYFLVDTAAGIADNVLQFIESSPYTFLLITPEPTSLTDSFSMLKLLNVRQYKGRLRAVVNMADDYAHASETFRRFAGAVEKYLEIKLEYGGFVTKDNKLPQSVMHQTPVVDYAADSSASRCLFALADNMLKHIGSTESENGLADYWGNVLQDTISTEVLAIDQAPTEQSALHQPEIESKPESASLLNFAELSAQLISSLNQQAPDRNSVEQFVKAFIDGFVSQFGTYPDSFERLLFRWLEANQYPDHSIKELVATLEAIYLSRHQQPMHNLENSIGRLIAQYQDSETLMRELIQQLRNAYQRSFQVDVFDARQELLDTICKPDFSEEDYIDLQNKLALAFQHRFKRPYQSKSDLLLKSTTESLLDLSQDEQSLQTEIDGLKNHLQQINGRREQLLKTLTSEAS